MADVATAEADAAQNAILAAATTYYLGLNTADPGATGANEDTTLTRQSITVAASSGGTQASNNAQSFANMPGAKTYTSYSVWTAATAGTYLRGGTLTASVTPAAGTTVAFASGAITFTAS